MLINCGALFHGALQYFNYDFHFGTIFACYDYHVGNIGSLRDSFKREGMPHAQKSLFWE